MSPERKLWQSQNFITRPDLVEDLLRETNIGADDLVVEIGPGRGIITEALTRRARQVIAVEKDELLAQRLLSSSLVKQSNFSLVVGDFLEWPLPSHSYKVFSNIPFNMTTDIVDKLTTADFPPLDAYLIMQEAAAHRFIGPPHINETLKSVLLKIKFEVVIVRAIPSSAFQPRPRVKVVLTHFHRKDCLPLEANQVQEFRDFIVYGYTQWQPTVLAAFQEIFTSAQRRLIASNQGISELKPTDLTFDQWLHLFKTYLLHVKQWRRQKVRGSEQRLNKQQKKAEKRHRTRKS